MSKLYIGNLPLNVNEVHIKQLLAEHNVPITNILFRRNGYAFIDCADQSIADRAIDKLYGINFLGNSLIVEPFVATISPPTRKGSFYNVKNDNETHSNSRKNSQASTQWWRSVN